MAMSQIPTWYVSKCPELGVSICGISISDAASSLNEVIDLYIENAEAIRTTGDIEESLTSTETKFLKVPYWNSRG